jgi:hypothetical protein
MNGHRFGIQVALLLIAGALPLSAADSPPRDQAIRKAIEKSIPLLESGMRVSREKRARCFTCHNQAYPVIALTTARDRGFAIDEKELKGQVQFTADFLAKNRKRYLQGRGQGGQVETAGWAMRTLEHGDWQADETTDAVAHYFLTHQKDLPHWKPSSARPPSTKSPFTSSHGAMRALLNFGGFELQAPIKSRLRQIREWTFETVGTDTQDRVDRLRTLQLLGEQKELARTATVLLRSQRDDGGWAQTPDMQSDSYATATALASLHQAGGLPTTDAAYRRGLQFLLNSQLPDGSWHVKTRAKPFQAYYESGYPHGKDQFISITAGAWATTALALALPMQHD